jgi:hypothetical protein
MKHSSILFGAAILFATVGGRAYATDGKTFEAELLSIQQAWAHVNYETPAGDARAQAFDALEKRARGRTRSGRKRSSGKPSSRAATRVRRAGSARSVSPRRRAATSRTR